MPINNKIQFRNIENILSLYEKAVVTGYYYRSVDRPAHRILLHLFRTNKKNCCYLPDITSTHTEKLQMIMFLFISTVWSKKKFMIESVA